MIYIIFVAALARSEVVGNHLLGRSEFVWCREQTAGYLSNHFAATSGLTPPIRGKYEWARARRPAGAFFFDSWQAGRRAVGTVWNSSQKLPPPHNSTQWDCSQGGWGIVRRSSPIELPLKCLTHRITNAMGDAMC